MKQFHLVFFLSFLVLFTYSQEPVYSTSATGLRYRIIPSGNKEATAKPGDWLKLHFAQMRNNDSILSSSYGKMPTYQQVTLGPEPTYNPAEIFPLLKKGDSVVVIIFIDSLVSKNIIMSDQLPPFLKRGDSVTLTMTLMEIFHSDSLYRADAEAEYERDRPRREQEEKEYNAKVKRDIKEARENELRALEQSGEAPAQRKVVEDYLARKQITAQRTAGGTYVKVEKQGSGPQVAEGKYLTVKYTGRILATDSTFESNTYSFQLGGMPVITGWEEGLLLFRQGGKGMLYIPGYMAYGRTPREGAPFGPNEALLFEIEILKVSDQP